MVNEVAPAQIAGLAAVVMVGLGFTFTVIVPYVSLPQLLVTVTEYPPASAAVRLVRFKVELFVPTLVVPLFH